MTEPGASGPAVVKQAAVPLAGPMTPSLRVLFVVDGHRITGGHGDGEFFGLGHPIDTLRGRVAVPWLDVDVELVHRGGSENFRFTQPGLGLSMYDQVWLFGDNLGEIPASDPNEPDSTIDDRLARAEGLNGDLASCWF